MTQVLKATEIDTLWMKDLWRGHEEEIIKTKISPDDSLIFVGYQKPAKIEVYNALNGDSIRTLRFPREASIMDDYDISKDGKYIMACENGDTTNIIHVWDMKTGNHLRTIFENDTNFTGFKRFDFIRITPDSRYLFISVGGKQYRDYKGELKDSASRHFVVDTSIWRVDREINIDAYNVFALSPDNKYYANVHYQTDFSIIQLRDIKNDTIVSVFMDSNNTLDGYTDLKFSPDSNYLMCHGGSYWYIWQIGQQNYYRKYNWDARKSIIPNSFSYKSGKIASHKYDTLTNTVRTLIYNFENENIVNDFNISSYEVLFFKTNNKILIRGYFYNLILIDSTWNTSIINNGENNTELVIMPNPGKEEILIKIRNETVERFSIRIFNNNGSLSYENENNSEAKIIENNSLSYRIDTSKMPNGTYFIELKSASGKVIFDKFIINR